MKHQVPVSTEYIKLDSFLKLCGMCGTGGEAKLMVQNGDVKVNGEECLQRGRKLFEGDTIAISGEEDTFTVTR